MKNRNLLLCTLLTAALLSACGEEPDSGRGRIAQTDTAATEGPKATAEATPTPEANDPWIHVDNMEDFVEAIGPGAQIRLETGSYSLSDYLEDAWDAEGEAWNRRHDYVQIREVFDGLELVIKDADGLVIKGGDSDCSGTELLTDPRYASVLNYEDCEQVVVSDITMGHTDRGNCVGDVIHCYNCKDVIVVNSDLFGCGVYGIYMDYCEGFLKCSNTAIHDCEYGPLYNVGSAGEWRFTNCRLVDSESGGYFPESPNLKLYFDNCEFGDRETENFMYRSDTTAVFNCKWGNPQNHRINNMPESGKPTEFHTDALSIVPFDDDVLEYSHWLGFIVTDEDTGETKDQETWMWFFEYDEGALVADTYEDFTWKMDSQYNATITLDDSGEEYGVVLYTDKNDGENALYLLLTMDGNDLWFYQSQ